MCDRCTSGEEKEEEQESEEQEAAEEQERGVVRGVQLVVKDEERGQDVSRWKRWGVCMRSPEGGRR